jgi:ATP-binding cassette, subfamily B (MDR/TAP), member 9
VVALVGPSGSGKSSCVCLLEQFYKPSKGEILIDSKPIADYDHKYIHRVVSFIDLIYNDNNNNNIFNLYCFN